MFSNLKKKISSAIQDGISVTENLQQQVKQRVSNLASGASGPTSPVASNDSSMTDSCLDDNSEQGLPKDINFTAGCKLLAKYEDLWEKIHDANVENTDKAEEIAQQIEAIGSRTEADRLVMTDLISCLAAIPNLVKRVKESAETLQQVSSLCESVETELEILENLCEDCDLQEFMLQKQYELAELKKKKMDQLESYRKKVAEENQSKIRQHEERLRELQRERQAVFDAAFRDDLEEYKEKGVLPKIQKELNNQITLEEVNLNDPKDALEEFLNS